MASTGGTRRRPYSSQSYWLRALTKRSDRSKTYVAPKLSDATRALRAKYRDAQIVAVAEIAALNPDTYLQVFFEETEGVAWTRDKYNLANNKFGEHLRDGLAKFPGDFAFIHDCLLLSCNEEDEYFNPAALYDSSSGLEPEVRPISDPQRPLSIRPECEVLVIFQDINFVKEPHKWVTWFAQAAKSAIPVEECPATTLKKGKEYLQGGSITVQTNLGVPMGDGACISCIHNRLGLFCPHQTGIASSSSNTNRHSRAARRSDKGRGTKDKRHAYAESVKDENTYPKNNATRKDDANSEDDADLEDEDLQSEDDLNGNNGSEETEEIEDWGFLLGSSIESGSIQDEDFGGVQNADVEEG